jgi:Outer membrane protein beta-barrel domain
MSRLLSRGLVVSALALTLAAAQAYAQDTQAPSPPARASWLGAGLGYGAFRTDCSNCTRDDLYSTGGSLFVSGGVAVNDRVDAGGEILWASTVFDAGKYRATFLLGVAQFRPWPTRGFYLKGGLGLAFIRASITVDGQTTESKPKGLGVHYGAGWMFGRERRVSFAPFGGHYVASLGDLPTAGGVAENPVSNVWFAGVTVFIR